MSKIHSKFFINLFLKRRFHPALPRTKTGRRQFHFVRGRAKRQRIISTTHTTVKQFCTRSLLKFRSLVQNFHRGGRKGRRNFFSMDTTLPNFWRRKMAGCPTATVRSTSSRCRLLPTTAPSCDNLAGSCFPKWRRTRVKARNREKFS